MNELSTTNQFSLTPKSIDEALRFADMLSKSNLVPKDFLGNPGNILVAIQWGFELGLQPMQALQNIAVINGRPSIWGDAVIALVKSSPVCEYVVEEINGERAICRVKRKNEPEQSRSFSIEDARKAGLLDKDVWKKYPTRMLQMRARSWGLRDVFPDVLRGMPIAEELQDIEINMGTAQVVETTTPQLPIYDETKFQHNFEGAWQKRVNEGSNPEDLLNMLKSKNTLTIEQENAIKSMKAKSVELTGEQA